MAEVGYYMVDGENPGLSSLPLVTYFHQLGTSSQCEHMGGSTTDDHNSSVPVTNANSNNKSWSTLMIREGDFKAKWI